jgi:hypothetical protein
MGSLDRATARHRSDGYAFDFIAMPLQCGLAAGERQQWPKSG